MGGRMNLLDHQTIGDEARPFVFSTFAASLRQSDVPSADIETYSNALERALRAPETRTTLVFPSGHPDEFLGWAVSTPDRLVYAYLRFDYRRSKMRNVLGMEGIHLGSQIIDRVSDPLWLQIPSALWTRDASRMAASGYPIRYDLDQNEQFKQSAR